MAVGARLGKQLRGRGGLDSLLIHVRSPLCN
jgi:hypothetical protein